MRPVLEFEGLAFIKTWEVFSGRRAWRARRWVIEEGMADRQQKG
jgi:hypothetical protein